MCHLFSVPHLTSVFDTARLIVSGSGVSGRRESRLWIAGRPGAAHGTHRRLLPGPRLSVRLPSQLPALHKTSRAAGRSLCTVRLSTETRRETVSGQGKTG